MAIALACGIGGFSCSRASFAAVVLGHIARREIRRREAGDGMATAGLVLGYIGSVIGVLLIDRVYLAVFLLASWS